MATKKSFFLKPSDGKSRKKTLKSLNDQAIDITSEPIFGGWKEVTKLRDPNDDLLASSTR